MTVSLTKRHPDQDLIDIYRSALRLGYLAVVVLTAGIAELFWKHEYTAGSTLVYALLITLGSVKYMRWNGRRQGWIVAKRRFPKDVAWATFAARFEGAARAHYLAKLWTSQGKHRTHKRERREAKAQINGGDYE